MSIYEGKTSAKFVSIKDERIGGTLQGSLDEASAWLKKYNPNVIEVTVSFDGEWDMWTVVIFYEA